MSDSQPARVAGLLARSTVLAALVVVSLALSGGLLYLAEAGPSASAASPRARESLAHRSNDRFYGDHPGEIPGRLQGDHAFSVHDGQVPAGVTVLDDGFPAVANLDPALLGALRKAASAAAGEGVELYVNSGWRSPAYQQRLLDQAVSTYGSRQEAARWVASPTTSPHVSGDAVDLGRSEATSWLSEHGAGYGLCQIYDNEPWHYELRRGAVDRGCPSRYADPTHDPRMKR